MGGWICGENDLDYPKIRVKMAKINWRENLLNWHTWVSASVSTCTVECWKMYIYKGENRHFTF